jgi:MFS family permease
MNMARSFSGVPLGTMAALMLAVFAVSMGFGVVLPLLPFLIERLLGASGDVAQVSRSTGLLTAIYTLALFLFAPVWGRMSDVFGRRLILLAGLIGFAATMLVFAFIENLIGLYAERFLSGLFAAAVTPVALAVIADLAVDEEKRARRLTFVSLAGMGGFLSGPMIGALLSSNFSAVGSLSLPLATTAVLALCAAATVAFMVAGAKPGVNAHRREHHLGDRDRWLVARLLGLSFVVAAGVGVFEVGLALRGKQELGLTRAQIAVMFTECSLVMIIVQAIVFSPWIKPEATRWMIAPALAALATGLFLVPYAADFALMLAVVGGVAASAGILSPILTFWISSKSGTAQGAAFGTQTAAASLGGAVGAAAGGLLFDVAILPHASFVLMTALTAFGFLLSLALPNLLASRKPSFPLPIADSGSS